MTPDASDARAVDEPTLVRRVKAGDETAFGTLVERYMDTGFAAALSVLGNPQDAEDAVQNAFIRALERIDQLKPGSPFGPWFFRVLRSTALNLRRREILRTHEEIPASASARSNPAREWEKGLTRQTVLSALSELPEMQRLAVTLYDLEGYSHKEIAGILDIAVGTSRAHVHHGRKSLRLRLGSEFVPIDDEERKDDRVQ
ncbi:MAG: RNA polymerase sigma factor [marine benthic group bacterium]|nr:RNA polymerase sigma factor [Gemmatimonadota bacterium]MCL7966162.1 RNA polymerase sigma factor [Gemmatimonadota bacterium]